MGQPRCYLCGALRGKNSKRCFHAFPSNREQRSLWIQTCYLIEGVDEVKNLLICSKHFRKDDYVDANARLFGGNLRLKNGAVPSIKVPNPLSITKKVPLLPGAFESKNNNSNLEPFGNVVSNSLTLHNSVPLVPVLVKSTDNGTVELRTVPKITVITPITINSNLSILPVVKGFTSNNCNSGEEEEEFISESSEQDHDYCIKVDNAVKPVPVENTTTVPRCAGALNAIDNLEYVPIVDGVMNSIPIEGIETVRCLNAIDNLDHLPTAADSATPVGIIKMPRYAGDLKTIDKFTPQSAKYSINMLLRTVNNQRKKIKALQQKNRRLVSKLKRSKQNNARKQK